MHHYVEEPGGGSCVHLTQLMGVNTRVTMVGPHWQDRLTDEQIGVANLVREQSDRSDAHNLSWDVGQLVFLFCGCWRTRAIASGEFLCSVTLHSKSRFRVGRVLANTRDACQTSGLFTCK